MFKGCEFGTLKYFPFNTTFVGSLSPLRQVYKEDFSREYAISVFLKTLQPQCDFNTTLVVQPAPPPPPPIAQEKKHPGMNQERLASALWVPPPLSYMDRVSSLSGK